MASAIIHMAVAKKVNEYLKLNEKELLLGSVAPDIAKMVGSTRNKSHFIVTENTDTPNVKFFLDKYTKYLNNPFELGYYIHLLTDVVWFDSFLKNFVEGDYIRSKNGEKIKFTEEEITEIIYNDYSNLNIQVIDYYNMDLSLYYTSFPYPECHIEEISSEYFKDVQEKLGIIVRESSNHNYILDIEKIIHFIEYTTIYCLDEIKKIKL